MKADPKVSEAAMAARHRREMNEYYEAQAGTYDEFYAGKGQAIGALGHEYRADTAAVARVLSRFGKGELVDLACGTGFWLEAYGSNCTGVTLVDQSTAVLAKCRRRVRDLGLDAVARLVRGDIFELPFVKPAFDSAMLGFLLSHLDDRQIALLFTKVRPLLRRHATLAVVDSAWSEARQPYRQKDGFEERPLGDGRAFRIRKRYFEYRELEQLLEQHGFRVTSTHVGKVFVAAVAVDAA